MPFYYAHCSSTSIKYFPSGFRELCGGRDRENKSQWKILMKTMPSIKIMIHTSMNSQKEYLPRSKSDEIPALNGMTGDNLPLL